MADHLSDWLRDFIPRWMPPPPARVLDVGCGDGESTRWLVERGFEAIGVDPEAPAEPGFVRARIQEYEAPEPFDAALAMRSLHHAGRLDAAVDAIAAALAPGARLVVFEYAIEAIDERALRWCAQRGLRMPATLSSAHEVSRLAEVRAALDRRFRELVAEPAPYLAREAGHPELEPAERVAIKTRQLKPAGARLAYELG